MKIKNNTNKPIGIGVMNLLPGTTEVLPVAYENHPVVKMLATKKYDEEHTFVTLIAEKAPKAGKGAKGAEKKAETDAAQGAETGSEE